MLQYYLKAARIFEIRVMNLAANCPYQLTLVSQLCASWFQLEIIKTRDLDNSNVSNYFSSSRRNKSLSSV